MGSCRVRRSRQERASVTCRVLVYRDHDFGRFDLPYRDHLSQHPKYGDRYVLEARRISERTKAALQAAKARGQKLGSPIAAKTVAKARAARPTYAAKANATTLAVIREVQKSGIASLAGIARTLEARGVKTPAGRNQWQPVLVSRLLAA
jgi:hypothetical protein